ncbi:MAG TPA: enhanced serine sensitivity protein SseB C-terminal domain-containing protein [Trebonia sp.]|jgi:hypothetical protein|nr:enhanced serine sensitivity protein SseB C-terminal domain-containing protein [Trebonia sp.]
MAHGSTVVRPGAVAWGDAPGAADAAHSSCDAVEQVLAAAVRDAERIGDLLDELARARVWVPLPGGGVPVTDGSSVALPTVMYLGEEFVPCFTSVQRLGAWPDVSGSGHYGMERRHSAWHPGDRRMPPHIVVPTAALARRLPQGIGIALNPGAEASVPIYPEGVAHLAAPARTADVDIPVRVGHPPDEPEALLREVRGGLHDLPMVRAASRAWLCVPGRGEGLVISVALDDPADALAQEAVAGIIERVVAAMPHQAPFPIDVTFPGESEPDLVDDWVAKNTRPFYLRT